MTPQTCCVSSWKHIGLLPGSSSWFDFSLRSCYCRLFFSFSSSRTYKTLLTMRSRTSSVAQNIFHKLFMEQIELGHRSMKTLLFPCERDGTSLWACGSAKYPVSWRNATFPLTFYYITGRRLLTFFALFSKVLFLQFFFLQYDSLEHDHVEPDTVLKQTGMFSGFVCINQGLRDS